MSGFRADLAGLSLDASEILESLADPVVAFDKHWRYTYVSRRAAKTLGKTPEELLGKSMWEAFPDDSATGFQDACHLAWAEHRPITVERYSNVLRAWVENYIYPFENGASTQWRDITERKLAESALRASEERNRRLATLLEASDQAFAIGYPDGRIGYVNPAYERLTGYEREELLTMDWSKVLTPPEWRDTERAKLEELRATGAPVRYEKEYICKDGSRVPVELLVHFSKAEPDGPIYFSFLTDLTERKRIETALRESESRLRTLGDNLPEAAIYLYRQDAEGRPHVDFISAGIERLTGVPAFEYMNDAATVEREILPEDVPRLRAGIAASREQLSRFELEVRHKHRVTGEIRWSLLRATPTRQADGSTVWDGIELDITERKRAEAALQESEQKLRSAFAHASIGFSMSTAEGRFIDANAAYCAITGYSVDELRATGYQKLIHPDDLAENMKWIEEMLAGAVDGFVIENRYIRKDGSIVWVRKSISLVRNAEGAPQLIIALIEDVTERKRQRDELLESEARFRFVVESSMIGVVFADPLTGQIFDANEEFLRIVGRTRRDLPRLNWKQITAPDSLARDEEAIAAVPPGGRLGPFEKEYVRPDGSRVPAIVAGSFLDDTRRRLVAFVLDHSEQKRAEEHLRQAQKLESIGLLAGGIAHDFNNLLVAVVGGASLALDMIPAESGASELLLRVLKTGEQLAHLTRQLLAYSGKGRFVIEPVNLSAAVPEMIALIQASISKKIALRLELDANLPLVEADRGQIQQVLMNLVFNAAEAIGNNSGSICVRTAPQNVDRAYLQLHPEWDVREGEYIRLEVQDDGCGMDAASQAKIFDPFFTTKFVGRGLGLAAVSGIIRSHKGAIAVVSAPGAGSTFTVLLPTAAPGRAEALATRPTPSPLAARGTGTILIVDDEMLVREMAGKTLRRQGFEVLQAESAAAAIDVLKRHPGEIQAIVLDLSMPGKSGNEVLPELRQVRPGVRVIVSSGYDEGQTMAMFQGQAVAGFIQKPYTAAALVEKVRAVME